MLAALRDHLRAEGMTRIDCGCHRANEGAWRFYERLGFRAARRRAACAAALIPHGTLIVFDSGGRRRGALRGCGAQAIRNAGRSAGAGAHAGATARRRWPRRDVRRAGGGRPSFRAHGGPAGRCRRAAMRRTDACADRRQRARGTASVVAGATTGCWFTTPRDPASRAMRSRVSSNTCATMRSAVCSPCLSPTR